MKLFFFACAAFVITYFVVVFTPEPMPDSHWDGFRQLKNELVPQFRAAVKETGEGQLSEQWNTLLAESDVETVMGVLIEAGYLTDHPQTGAPYQQGEALAPFTDTQVLIMAKKFRGSKLPVAPGHLLEVVAQRPGGADRLEIYLAAYHLFGAKKTKNRSEMLNRVFAFAAPETTRSFLLKVGVFDPQGAINTKVIQVFSVSNVDAFSASLLKAGDLHLNLVEALFLNCVSPGNDAADHRSAKALMAVHQKLDDQRQSRWWQGLFQQMVARADHHIALKFLQFLGYVKKGEDGKVTHDPALLTSLDSKVRSQLARHLGQGYVSEMDTRIIAELTAE